jgi:hypothetical protein
VPEYRVEYQIQRLDGDEVTEIGFGSSARHDDVDAALYDVDSQVQNRQWETGPGQPDPRDVDAGRP